MKKIKYIAITAIIAIMALIPSSAVVAAPIATPSTLTIDQLEVYRNALELNDQLYLISYTIEYGANPSETAYEAFLIRLMNGATELASIPCAEYFDDGYDSHVVSIYFDAASAPAWSGAYTVYLQGNPALAWVAGTPPSVSNSTFSLWYDGGLVSETTERLTTRLRAVGTDLERDWGGTTDLVETIAKGVVLTTDGEEYFTSVITRLRDMCPDLFAEVTVPIDYTEETYTQTYANTLANRLLGTIFDTTNAATPFNLSRMWFNSLVWVFLVMAPVMFVVVKASNSFRPAMLAGTVLVPVGALAGFVPLLAAVGFTFILGLVIIYAYFYSKTA